tara:strand:- start:211 stop:414 length:204 start_codon:yes stop_codon:yes gene_type:complete
MEKIEEFEKTEMKSPEWVALHPHVYQQLRFEQTRTETLSSSAPTIMGLEPRIDASKEPDFMEVGIEK